MDATTGITAIPYRVIANIGLDYESGLQQMSGTLKIITKCRNSSVKRTKMKNLKYTRLTVR